MAIYYMRNVSQISYGVESSYGTDPGSRLAFLGDVKDFKLTVNEHREPRRCIRDSLLPKAFHRGMKEITFDLSYELADDNPNNSVLSLALGSAPNGSTGAITIYPTTGYPNLRSFTIEGGTEGEYHLVSGCMIENYKMEIEEDKVLVSISGRAKTHETNTSLQVSPPGESSTSLFAGFNDVSLTWSNPGFTIQPLARKLTVEIANALKFGGQIGGGREITYCQIVGREVKVTGDFVKNSAELVSWASAETGSPGQNDLSIELAKNSNAEYISIALTDCEVTSDYGATYKDADEEIIETYTFIPLSYSFDVKA